MSTEYLYLAAEYWPVLAGLWLLSKVRYRSEGATWPRYWRGVLVLGVFIAVMPYRIVLP